MVSKNNFQANRSMQMQMPQQRSHNNVRAAIAPYRKPFRQQAPMGPAGGGSGNQAMYSSCQIPSDPLYIDFNNPTPPTTKQLAQTGDNDGNSAGGPQGKAKKTQKGKPPKAKQQTQPYNAQYGASNSWPQHKQRFNAHPGNRFNGVGGGQRNPGGFNRGQMGGGGPPNRMGGRNMMPPIVGMGPRGVGPMPPYPPMGFQPPIQPMRGGPMPAMGMGHVPPFMRRNGRNGPMPPPPLMGPHMMGPRMPPRGPPAGPYMGGMNGNGMNGGKIKKPNAKMVKQAVKGKSTIRTLKNLINQYPIDKPWVTEEIRAEHQKKIDIENRLKGNKDDDLFAQFKVHRDKFVGLYEAAREEYLKQEAATVMAKDAKDKDKNANSNQQQPNKADN